jgi:hypothetical protein
MKLSYLLSVAIAGVIAGAPVAAFARDHHDGHHDGHHDSHHSDHHYGHYYGPRFGLNLGYGYPYYGYGYGGYGYGYGYPYYYRPTIGLAFSSPIYRGVPASGYYSDSLAVDVQRELRRHGYYHGAIDGAIGPESRGAIRAYQADRGLGVTGRIDSRLLRSLGIG